MIRKKIEVNLNDARVPPNAIKIESEIIGSILNQPNSFDIVSDVLKPEVFYVELHSKLFKAFISLRRQNIPIDVLTVIEELKKHEETDLKQLMYDVMEISKNAKFGLNIEAHSKIVLSKFLQREIIRISGEAIGEAYEDATDVQSLIDDLTKKIDKLNAGIYTKEANNMLDNAMQAKIAYDTNKQRKEGEISGITSGFRGIDKVTFGFQPTDLIILAARPSIGKSCLSGNFAVAAAKNRIAVGLFSLEMSVQQYTNRIISAESGVDLEKINRGTTNEIEDRIVNETINRISSLPIYIDDTAGLSLIEFRSKARKLVNKYKVGLIIIDYLQLMTTGTDNNKKSRDIQLGEISGGIKRIAKELNVPIIPLAQLSRDIEKRKGEAMPNLSDLRDSGNIEQDADIVMFLYNEEGLPKIRIGKNRNGVLATIKLKSDLKIQRFLDFEPQPFSPIREQTFDPAKKDEQFDEGFNNNQYEFN